MCRFDARSNRDAKVEVPTDDSVGDLLYPQVTRIILQLGSTVALLPILNSGLQVYQCSGTWLGTSLKCFSSVHLLICVGISILLLLFSTIAVFCTCVYLVCSLVLL